MPAQCAHSPTGGREPSENAPLFKKNSFPADKEKVSPSPLWDGTKIIVLQLLPSCLAEALRRHSAPPVHAPRTCRFTFVGVAVVFKPNAHKLHFFSPEVEGKRTPQCKKTGVVAAFAAAAVRGRRERTRRDTEG